MFADIHTRTLLCHTSCLCGLPGRASTSQSQLIVNRCSSTPPIEVIVIPNVLIEMIYTYELDLGIFLNTLSSFAPEDRIINAAVSHRIYFYRNLHDIHIPHRNKVPIVTCTNLSVDLTRNISCASFTAAFV